MKQTTLCYLQRPTDGAYLMLHRIKKAHDPSHGKWIGLGGKCLPDEGPDECMVREVREESGLTITRYRARGLVTFISDCWESEQMHLFTASAYEGTLIPPDACREGVLRWVAPSQILTALELWEGDRIFLPLLMQEDRTEYFYLKLIYQGDHLQEATLNLRPLKIGGCSR